MNASIAVRHAIGPRADASPWTAFHWALSVMMLTYVWRLQDVFPVFGKAKISLLATVIAYLLFLSGSYRLSRAALGDPVLRAVLFILFMMFVSVPWGIYPGFTFRFIFEDHIKTVLFMVMLIAAIRCFRDVERFALVHVFGGIIFCGMSLWGGNVGSDGKLSGVVYYDANDLALLGICTLPLAIYLWRRRHGTLVRLFGLSAAAILALTTIRSGSRGGFLGLLAVLIWLLVGYREVKVHARVGAVLIVLAFVLLVSSDDYLARIETLVYPEKDYNWSGNATTGRMEIWKRGIGYMLSYPLTGVGASAFFAAEGMLSFAELQAYGQGIKWSVAHNSFVQIGAELGLPGLIAFVLLLRAAFVRVQRIRPPTGDSSPVALGQLMSASIAGYVVSGFFLSQAYSAFAHTFFALAVGLTTVTGLAAESGREDFRPRTGTPGAGRTAHPVPMRRRGGGWGVAV